MPDLKQTLVMKFGGTSVGSVDALTKANQIIKDAHDEYPRLVVITSAMSGVTDLLLKCAMLAAQGNVDSLPSAESTLREKHFSAADALINNEPLREDTKQQINCLIQLLVDLCRAIAVLGEASPRALDAVSSLGERMSLRLLGAIAESAGVKAKVIESSEFVVTNSHFQNANPDFQATTEKTRGCLDPLLDEGIVAITTGFIGATPDGVITTLGRGGSDYSAAIIGSLRLREIERLIGELEQTGRSFPAPRAVLALLASLRRAGILDAALLARFHDALLFLCAYPATPQILRRAESPAANGSTRRA